MHVFFSVDVVIDVPSESNYYNLRSGKRKIAPIVNKRAKRPRLTQSNELNNDDKSNESLKHMNKSNVPSSSVPTTSNEPIGNRSTLNIPVSRSSKFILQIIIF